MACCHVCARVCVQPAPPPLLSADVLPRLQQCERELDAFGQRTNAVLERASSTVAMHKQAISELGQQIDALQSASDEQQALQAQLSQLQAANAQLQRESDAADARLRADEEKQRQLAEQVAHDRAGESEAAEATKSWQKQLRHLRNQMKKVTTRTQHATLVECICCR